MRNRKGGLDLPCFGNVFAKSGEVNIPSHVALSMYRIRKQRTIKFDFKPSRTLDDLSESEIAQIYRNHGYAFDGI